MYSSLLVLAGHASDFILSIIIFILTYKYLVYFDWLKLQELSMNLDLAEEQDRT